VRENGATSHDPPKEPAARRWRRAVRVISIAMVAILAAPLPLILLYRFFPPPITSLMAIRLAEGYPLHKEWATYHAMAATLRDAAIASEDDNFCQEELGFDVDKAEHEVHVWERGGHPKGASTITMQTARNLFLWPGRSIVRKLLEAWLTPQIALLWPKRRVIEVYLNIVEFGPGIYGAEAASQAYFSESASQLSLKEAALLVEMLPDPLHHGLAERDFYVGRAGYIAMKMRYGHVNFTCVNP
jgi:monofunctional biosynthetic peptidoglycan transglycosylase